MRPIRIHPISLLLGGSVPLCALLLMSQSNPTGQAIWPPPRSVVLNVFEEFSPPVQVASGGQYTVLTVPPDKWLTITGASGWCSDLGFADSFRWMEAAPGGAMTKKGTLAFATGGAVGPFLGSPEGNPAGSGGPIGWVFGPGSSVVLHNPHLVTRSIGYYSLIGYYSRL